MRSLRLFSPAKLNLFLNILYKRKDGFHELETLFERVSLTDRMTFKLVPSGIRLKLDDKRLPKGPKNLVYRAAALLRDECCVKKGVEITLKKNIPVGAGLGGGSSNAATTLTALNRLWDLGLSQKKLHEYASRLGSDVPFFLMDTSFALGRGRGEKLTKIKPPPYKLWHCVVKPPFSISTKEAYSALNPLFLTPKKANVRMLFHSIQTGCAEDLSSQLTNSLEHALNKRVMTIFSIKNELARAGALGCLMSGSGSSVFGIFTSQTKAQRASRFLKRHNKSWKVFAVSTY